MKANVKQAIAYLAALNIPVRGRDVVFNENDEITFTSLQNGRDLIAQLSKLATSTTKYGYTTFKCGDVGELTVEPLGMLGCSISLTRVKQKVVVVKTSHLPGQMHIDYHIAAKLAPKIKGAVLDTMGNFEISKQSKFEQSLRDAGFKQITMANTGFTEPAWVNGRTLIHFNVDMTLGMVAQLVAAVR